MTKAESLSRRNWMRATAAVPFAAVTSTAANDAISVGVIGTGGRGTYDAQMMRTHTSARIAALCDLDPSRMERAKERIPAAGAKLYEDYRDLLASDEIDAVIIATPVFLHPEHFEAAVRAGKHIYIEKPAGTDVAGCKRIMRAADAADRNLNIAFGFQQRYGPGYHKARALMDSGDTGELRMATANWIKGVGAVNLPPAPKPLTLREKSLNWKSWRETFGDFIVETFCHGIDVLNWFCGGHPQKAIGTGGRKVIRRGDMLDHVNVAFTYSNDLCAMLNGSVMAPTFHRDVREQFICENTVIETTRQSWKRLIAKNDWTGEQIEREITADAVETFIRRIREGKPENTGVRGAESTLTAIMARMAVDGNREVTWEEVLRS